MNCHPLDLRARLAALLVPVALAACGGSDDSSSGAGPGPGPGTAALSISGTAATGAAIAGGAVDVKCNGGSGNATTQADGSYKIDLAQGALPCLVRVTSGATVLHSITTGSGASARANITPVSELVVASLAGQDPAAYFAAFEAGAAPAAAQVQAAVASVTAQLKGAGVDLTGIDVLAGTLVAASGATAGNAFDQALEALKTQLAAVGTTLAELRETIVRESPAAPPTALNATPSLPAELLLRPAAPNCSALRSGKYRLVFFTPGEGGSAATDTIMLDAPTLTATAPNGEVSQLTAAGDCRYTLPNGGELAVAASGVGVFRSLEDATYRVAMVMPEQSHPVSALAGTWNYIGMGDTTDIRGVRPFLGEMTVGGNGSMTSGVYCDDLTTCQAEGPDARQTFVANAAGGFDFDGGSRAFAYRSGSGELVLVVIDPDGSMALATRKVKRELSPIGAVNRSSNFTLQRNYTALGAPSDSENTTVSHAVDGSSWTRNAVIDFATGVTRPEKVQINVPRDGFIRRVPETVTTSNGGTSNVGEWIGLTLRGIGITPVAIVANNQLVFSVAKP